MPSKYLPPDEWDLLDTLIGKIGFGGYYDLLECLNMIASDLAKIAGLEFNRQKTLCDAVTTISGLVTVIKKRDKVQ